MRTLTHNHSSKTFKQLMHHNTAGKEYYKRRLWHEHCLSSQQKGKSPVDVILCRVSFQLYKSIRKKGRRGTKNTERRIWVMKWQRLSCSHLCTYFWGFPQWGRISGFREQDLCPHAIQPPITSRSGQSTEL